MSCWASSTATFRPSRSALVARPIRHQRETSRRRSRSSKGPTGLSVPAKSAMRVWKSSGRSPATIKASEYPPCVTAFRDEIALPVMDLGPVDFIAFRRLLSFFVLLLVGLRIGGVSMLIAMKWLLRQRNWFPTCPGVPIHGKANDIKRLEAGRREEGMSLLGAHTYPIPGHGHGGIGVGQVWDKFFIPFQYRTKSRFGLNGTMGNGRFTSRGPAMAYPVPSDLKSPRAAARMTYHCPCLCGVRSFRYGLPCGPGSMSPSSIASRATA